MATTVTEIAPDVFRISTLNPDYGIQFNQFLVRDSEPFLMHTGFRKMFSATLEGVASVLDPASLRWIGFSHFESDECGALNDWLRIAPRSQAVCSLVGTMVMVNDFADRPARPSHGRRGARPRAASPALPLHPACPAWLGRGTLLRGDRPDAALLRPLLPRG
jgi:flavorubredoxin